jgi:hypothetical protein
MYRKVFMRYTGGILKNNLQQYAVSTTLRIHGIFAGMAEG